MRSLLVLVWRWEIKVRLVNVCESVTVGVEKFRECR